MAVTAADIKRAWPEMPEMKRVHLFNVIRDAQEEIDAHNDYDYVLDPQMGRIEKAMQDGGLTTYGIEYGPQESEINPAASGMAGAVIIYVNVGEAYDPTVYYNYRNQEFWIGSWGHWLGEYENEHYEEINPLHLVVVVNDDWRNAAASAYNHEGEQFILQDTIDFIQHYALADHGDRITAYLTNARDVAEARAEAQNSQEPDHRYRVIEFEYEDENREHELELEALERAYGLKNQTVAHSLSQLLEALPKERHGFTACAKAVRDTLPLPQNERTDGVTFHEWTWTAPPEMHNHGVYYSAIFYPEIGMIVAAHIEELANHYPPSSGSLLYLAGDAYKDGKLEYGVQIHPVIVDMLILIYERLQSAHEARPDKTIGFVEALWLAKQGDGHAKTLINRAVGSSVI